MIKWHLFWVLLVQTPDGEIDERHMGYHSQDSQLICEFEYEAKIQELEPLLGGDTYKTDSGVSVRYGGTLVGYEVGCEFRKVRTYRGFGF